MKWRARRREVGRRGEQEEGMEIKREVEEEEKGSGG